MNIMLSTIISELTVHDNSTSLYTFLILHLLILLFLIEGCTFVIILSVNLLYKWSLYTIYYLFHEHLNEPVYISVDKDVLDIKSAVTNWDQGSLSLTELEKLLSIILKKEEIIGVDICGECSSSLDVFQKNRELSINSKANKELLNLFLSNQNEIHPL